MLFNYDPFSSFEENEYLYYKAALACFDNLDKYFNRINKKDSYNAFSTRTSANKSGKTRRNDRSFHDYSKDMD